MHRRALLAAGATTALAAPVIAQSRDVVRWRMASSFPKNLDTLWGASQHIATRVGEATEGRFQIQPFAAGELVGATQVADAVQNETIECGHTNSNFYVGKDPAFAFETGLPFGMNARQQAAWMTHGGGADVIRAFMAKFNIHTIQAGNTGAQMGGWYRKEVKTLEDLKGLKIRIPGIAGHVMSRLGAVPQQIGGSDVYPALERGTIDAAEWVGPYDDEKLGFYRVAPYYYYPGWWEGGAQVAFYVNLDKWKALPAHFRAALEMACAEAHSWMLAKYDAQNADALRRLVAAGAQLRPFSNEIMEEAYKQSFALYTELSAQENFGRIFKHWDEFRRKSIVWFRVSELPFDYFVQSRRG